MADSAEDSAALERSMRAVGAIRQVVHAIWALSRAQLPFVERAASAAVTYQRWIDETVERVAGPPIPGEEARELTVVFGPERPYSSALARRITEVLPAGELGIVGERLAESVRSIGPLRERVRFWAPGSVSPDDLHVIALSVASEILEHGRGARVLVMHPIGERSTMTTVPLIAARALVDRPPETYSSLGRVVESVVVEAMKGRLAVAAAEALRAEIQARILAADNARRACEERMSELESLWHFGRREAITRELLEIVAGREAASSRGP